MPAHQGLGGGGILRPFFFTEIQSFALYLPKDMEI